MTHAGAYRAYETPDLMQEQIDCFFANENTPTLGALATYLGLSYGTFLEYGKREGFIEVIELARQKSESFIEKGALRGDLNSTFSIFALKNRHGWKDKSETEVTHKGGLSLSKLFEAAVTPALPSTEAARAGAIEGQTVG